MPHVQQFSLQTVKQVNCLTYTVSQQCLEHANRNSSNIHTFTTDQCASCTKRASWESFAVWGLRDWRLSFKGPIEGVGFWGRGYPVPTHQRPPTASTEFCSLRPEGLKIEVQRADRGGTQSFLTSDLPLNDFPIFRGLQAAYSAILEVSQRGGRQGPFSTG